MLLTLRVHEVVAATPRARIVRLALDGQRFEYKAGQAILVAMDAAETRRPYSIANAPEDVDRDGFLELLVGVDPGGQTAPPFLPAAGAGVVVEGPIGQFTFPERPAERCFVFVAGGTGISPLRAMLRHAILGPSPVRHVGLLYSARTPEEFAFENEFRALATAGMIELRQTVTRAAEGTWSGARGRIDRAALSALVHDPETLCFICGPASMVDEIPRLLGEIGIARERIRIEEW